MEEIAGWRERAGPLTLRLSGALRDAIARGDLPAGRRLPPERTLAASLGISRSTVVAAYERLADEGWVDRLQGSGTFVAAVEAAAPEPGPNPIFSRMIEGGGPVVDLAVAAPAAAAAVGPALRAAALDAARFTGGHGYFTMGLPGLRQEVARLLRRAGVPATPDEVLITSGCQQAIALTAAALLEPGDPVLVESPTFPGALDAFRAVGARLSAVQLADDGLRAPDVELAMSRTRPRLLYLTPTFNNPTGTLLPAAGRARVAELAAEFQVPVVEDLTLADLAFEPAPPPPPLAAYPGGVVLTVGSASKLFWGGLRVGWVRAPRHLIERLARVKSVADIGTSLPSQLAAARLLPQAEAVRELRREELRGRRDLLASLLEELLPTWTWRLPAGGVSLWARLPGGGADEYAAVALRHGVAVVPGACFAPPAAGQPWADRLRLPFTLDTQQLETGVRRLARAWQDHQRAARRSTVTHRAVV